MHISDHTPQQEAIDQLKAEDPSRSVVILTNWKRIWDGRLAGDVRNHPKLGDHDSVITTPVRYLNEEAGIAVTHNTIYALSNKREN
jgi:hypothetical protein